MTLGMVRWGIIGCGDVTEVKSGPALQKANRSSLAAVMRRRGELARDYAVRHGVARWYDDAQKLIDDPGVDAVYIATPPANHRAYALACAKSGKPAYVEKPMALTHDECLEMNEAFDVARLPLFIAYYRRALPRFAWVKELVDSGAIGEPRFVRVTLRRRIAEDERDTKQLPWRVLPEIAGGGRFVDLGSHVLDLLDWILGPIDEVAGVAVNQARLYPAEDCVAFSARFASGVVGAGVFAFTASSDGDVVEIQGARGALAFSAFDDEPVRVTGEYGETCRTIAHPPHIQQPLIQSVVDQLCGMGNCPSSGATAARTSLAIDRILAGYREKGRVLATSR
ncbi:MAG: Gfo/Idh/MocA family oxidoreductase [Myxococcota bacterium]|nr:Gfo/Idh/MocA family oxidoreductase [Myxococcota bacterium]